MPNKTVTYNFNAIEENHTLTYDTRSVSKILKKFFSKLSESLLIKLPQSLSLTGSLPKCLQSYETEAYF